MKKNVRLVASLLAMMMLLCLVLACNNDTPQPVSYTTPTATGRISLPPSSGLTNDSIHLLVYETGYQGKVNADGTWLVSGLEAGKSYTVFFQDKPFVDLSRSLSPDAASFGARKANVMGATEAGYDNGMVQIKPTATVNGSVTSEGLPVSDVTVSIPGTPYVAQSDSNGEFTLAGLSDGTYDIAFNRRGYVDATYEAFTVITETGTSRSYELDPVELAQAAGTIRGSVSFEGSSSVGNRSASVSVYSNDNPSSSRSVFTDSTGQFVIDGLAAGTYTVTISSTASYRPVTINDVVVSEAGSTTLEPVMLSAIGGRIYGKVSSVGDSAFTSALITLTSTTGDEVYYRTVGRNEDYAIEDIIPGTYSYTVECDTYATISGTLKVTVGSDEKFDFILEAVGGSVNGRVILDGNWTNSGAKVRIANINDTTKTYETTTSSDGSFTIDNIRYEGAYRVSITADNYVSAQDITVDVKFGERTTISDTITLKPVAGIVKGNVTFADAQMHGGIQLILRNSSYTKESTTENGGDYIFESVQPGTYQLLIQADGYVERTFANIVVQQSEIVEIEPVVLDRIRMPLSGKVTLEGGQPAAGVLVNAVNIDNAGLTYSTMTGNDGTYEIREMAVGTYRLTFSLDEYMAYETNVAMEPGRNAVADATLSLRYGSLAGTVVLEGQDDASGVTITLIGENGTYATESGEDGRFSITQIEPGLYNATFAKLGYLTWSTSCVITAGKGSELSPTLEMGYAIITGKVVLSDGNDSSGVTVTVKSLSDSSETYSAKAEADGSFNIVDIRTVGRYQLTASCDGYASYNSGSLSVVMGEVTEVEEITLSSLSGSLSGTLKLDASLSHDGIKIVLSNDEASYEATSDVDGSFRIPVVSPGTYALTASCDGYIDRSVTGIIVTQGQETRLEEMTLSQTRLSLTGTIKLEDASDHSGVLVTLAKEGDGETLYSAVTIADGTYSIGNIIPGEYVLTASRTGYSEYSTKVVLAAGRDYSEDTTLKAGSGIISGHVFLSGASDYSGITVSIVNSRNPEVSHQAVTGADGSFSITGVRTEGLYLVTASKDGYVTDSSTSVTVKFGTTAMVEDITLARMDAVVKGRVLFSGLSAHEGIEISLENDDYNLSATTDNNGEFVIREVAPGTYRLTASADGYASRTIDPVVVAQSATVAVEDITLAKEVLPLSGTVTLEGLGDYSNTLVTATSTADEELVYSTYTDESGKYTIESMQVGSYELTFSHDGYESYTTRITVIAGESLNVDAELELGSGIITGTVLLEGTSDYSGITITATLSSDSSTKYSATTTADGLFSIVGIEKGGTYLITASKTGFNTDGTKSVSVSLGQVSSIGTLTLYNNNATIRGIAQLEGALSHEGIKITLQDRDEELSYSTTTDAEGEYIITGITPGMYYTVSAIKAGYSQKSSAEQYISESANLSVDTLVLPIALMSLTGTVDIEGADDYGAIVRAENLLDASLTYTAVTNSSGVFTLVGMQPGQYQVTISLDGYRTVTLETIEVVSENGTIQLEDTILLPAAKGTLIGFARLEGLSDHSGITVQILDTSYSTTTAEDGSFSLPVVPGVYINGVTFSKEDYETAGQTISLTVESDKTYPIGEVTLKGLAAPVSGKVDVLLADDDSGVTVSIDGTEFTMLTGSDGTFSFEHVPVGSYSLILERENAVDVTVGLTVAPGKGADLGTITLVPKSASIYGTVMLDGLDDHSDVDVTAVPSDDSVSEMTVLSEASGYFRMGNLLSTSDYTVTFSKAGWDSQSIEVSGLTPLEEREVTADSPITLKDTTAPVLDAVTINDGANTTSERTVQITLDAFDEGSGLAKMQYCYDGVFDRTVTMRDYQESFELDLPGDNGDKTLYVKVFDTSGNESGVMSATVTLTDQIKGVEGVLSGDDLHWTKDKSPYLVTGNVLVPEGETLIIDPGVDVQFNGEFYMQVEGAIQAIGTESERIKIYGFGEGVDKWTGIRVQNDNGSLFDYVDVYDSYRSIEGYADVSNSSIESTYSSDGRYYFYGDMTNVTMNVSAYSFSGSTLDNVNLTSDGTIYASEGLTVKDSELEINGELSSSYDSSMTIMNSTVSGVGSISSSSRYSPLTIMNSTVSGVGSISSHDYSPLTIMNSTVSGVGSISTSLYYSPLTIMNSTVSGVGSIYSSSDYSPVTIMNSTVSGVGSISTSYYDSPVTIVNSTVSGFESILSFDAMKIVNTILTDIGEMSGESFIRINNSNMNNCGTLSIEESRSDRTTVDLRGNFWGYDKTREFNESTDGDVGFIEDYYDDFNLARGDYSGYLEEPIENIGVPDESFVPVPPSGVSYEIGDIGPGGGLVMYVDTEDAYPDFDYIEVLETGVYLPFGYYRVDGDNTEVGTSDAVGAGDENTAALVDAMGEYMTFTDDSDDDIGLYAAGLASVSKAGGYDWYLPSSSDAELIAQSGLIEDDFWTSTEDNETYAYYYDVSNGRANAQSKGYDLYITVCRYF